MKSNWLLLVHHDPILDPRISWICRHSPQRISIEVLAYIKDYKTSKHWASYKNKKYTYHLESAPDQYEKAVNLLMTKIIDCKNAEIKSLTKMFLDLYPKQFQADKKTYMNDGHKFLFHCSSVLMQAEYICKKIPDGIIASDFYTLLAGVYVSLLWNRPLIYEAHEYFSEESPNMPRTQSLFWKQQEKVLLKFTDARFIVTKELGLVAKKELSASFSELLNAVPLKK